MKLKLMISALLLCSSLSLAGDLTTAPTAAKKKAPRVTTTMSVGTGTGRSEESSLGGIGTSSAAPKPKKAMMPRGSSTGSER